MEKLIQYKAEELLNFPHFESDKSGTYYYHGIVLVPTGKIREDANGYPEFAIIGCHPQLIPKEILCYVHGAQMEFLLDPIKGRIKFHMIGPNIFQIWSSEHMLAFHLTSNDVMDFHFVKRP